MNIEKIIKEQKKEQDKLLVKSEIEFRKLMIKRKPKIEKRIQIIIIYKGQCFGEKECFAREKR